MCPFNNYVSQAAVFHETNFYFWGVSIHRRRCHRRCCDEFVMMILNYLLYKYRYTLYYHIICTLYFNLITLRTLCYLHYIQKTKSTAVRRQWHFFMCWFWWLLVARCEHRLATPIDLAVPLLLCLSL